MWIKAGKLGIVCALLCLSGCKTKQVSVPEWHTRDSVVLRLQRDSVYLRDSVFLNTYMKGDTVFSDRVRTRYLYRDRVRTDTVVVHQRDSVSVAVPVERELRWYDRAARWIAVCAIGFALALVVFLLVRK